MGRRRRPPCCDKVGLKKGPWTPEEDKKLVEFLGSQGAGWCWRDVAKVAGLRRCGKSCRLRWTNYLRPDLKKGLLSEDEVQLIIDLHSRLGNRWSKIAAELPGRTDNDVKNYWNTRIKRKLIEMGIDPNTHLPLNQQRPPGTTDVVVTSHLPSTNDHLQQQPEASLKTTPDSSVIDDREWSFLMDNGGVAGEFAMLLSGSTPADDSKYSSSSWWLKCDGFGNEEFEFGFLDEMG